MRLQKTLCAITLGIAGLLATIFLVDLITGLFFDRFSIWTDLLVIIAASLILWQGLETWFELK